VYGTLYLTVSLYVANAALLWTAPELLRIPRSERPSEGTYSGDVFSFGIIIYETCYLIQPYGEQLNKLGARGALNASVCVLNSVYECGCLQKCHTRNLAVQTDHASAAVARRVSRCDEYKMPTAESIVKT